MPQLDPKFTFWEPESWKQAQIFDLSRHGSVSHPSSGIYCIWVFKVIIHRSSSEVSQVEQTTIRCVYVAYLEFIVKFPKKKLHFFHLHFMQLFSADATVFFLKKCFKFFAPQNMKNSPQKLLIIPLDHQFSVQQVFSLWNWDSFKVWNFLIFEVVKLCRMKKYLILE